MRPCGATGILTLDMTPTVRSALIHKRRWRARSSRRRSEARRMELRLSPCRQRALSRRRARSTCFLRYASCMCRAGGRPDKTSLMITPAGCAQRMRSTDQPGSAVHYSKAVAHYVVFLAAATGLVEGNAARTPPRARPLHLARGDARISDTCVKDLAAAGPILHAT
jgi:hypothetical protein